MPALIVAYDLLTPGKDYDTLIKALEGVPHCHVQQSVWFINVDRTPVQVRDWLAQFLDTNDKLFVDNVTTSWAGKAMPVCGNWLNNLGY